MITDKKAEEFGREWIEAWNAHDLERILAHYAPGIKHTTPFAVSAENPEGIVWGKDALRAYFARAFERIPDLHFEPIDICAGVNSAVIYYHAVLGKIGAEMLLFDENGLIVRSIAHYR